MKQEVDRRSLNYLSTECDLLGIGIACYVYSTSSCNSKDGHSALQGCTCSLEDETKWLNEQSI